MTTPRWIRPLSSEPHSGEGRLDRVGGAQVDPVPKVKLIVTFLLTRTLRNFSLPPRLWFRPLDKSLRKCRSKRYGMNWKLPLLVGTLCVTFFTSSYRVPVERDQKYYQLHELKIGYLTLTNVRVSLAAVKPNLDVDGFEVVPVFHLDRAQIDVKGSGNVSVFSGQLGEGSTEDPAGVIAGRFKWNGDQLEASEVTDLKFRIKQVAISASGLGSTHILVPPTTTAFLTNRDPITSSTTSSELNLTIPRSELQVDSIVWRGISLSVPLKSNENSFLAIQASNSPQVQVVSAKFSANRVSQTVSSRLDDFLPDLSVISGQAEFEGLALTIDHGQASLTANLIALEKPELMVPSRNLKVAAAAGVVVTDAQNPADVSAGQIRTANAPSQITSLIVTGDPGRIIEQLNLSGHLTDDVLLPTGNPDVRFIRASAQTEFYKKLNQARAESKPTSLRITGSNHVVDKVEKVDQAWDIITKIYNEGTSPKVICSLAVDAYIGAKAASAVKSLINVAYQSRAAVMLATWLNISTKINPEMAYGGAYHVARATNFLSENGKIIGAVAGKLVSPGNAVCDLLLGDGVPPSVATGLYQPQIMQSIAQPPDNWDQIAVRYSALLDGLVRTKLTPEQENMYKAVEDSAAKRSEFLANILQQESLTNEARQGLSKRTQDSYNAELTPIVAEQNTLRGINYRAEQVPLAQAQAEQARKEEAQRQLQNAMNNANGNAGQPGTVGGGQPGPPGGGQPGPAPSTPGDVPCGLTVLCHNVTPPATPTPPQRNNR